MALAAAAAITHWIAARRENWGPEFNGTVESV